MYYHIEKDTDSSPGRVTPPIEAQLFKMKASDTYADDLRNADPKTLKEFEIVVAPFMKTSLPARNKELTDKTKSTTYHRRKARTRNSNE